VAVSDRQALGRLRDLSVGIALCIALAGCSLLPGGSSGRVPTSVPTSGPTVIHASTAPATAAASPSTAGPAGPATTLPSIEIPTFPSPDAPTTQPTTRPSAAKGLRVRSVKIRGRSGSATWDIAVPHFSGAAVAAEANRRVRAAAYDLVAQVRREARGDGGEKRTLSGAGTVGTNDGRTVQVVIFFTDYLAGTAHPALYVTTTVVDLKRSRPVLLSQVVQNPPEGLRFLRTQVIKAARKKGEDLDRSGLAPKISNYANWQTGPKGLTFYFGDYQLGGHGIRAYTVPWTSAGLVLSAYGEKLLAP
jgi:hypothetical protein